MNNDTIAAIATPHGTGGISIIKISGSEALSAVVPLFRPRNPNRSLMHLKSQTMIFGHICDPMGGDEIDEVLVSVLRGPHSFTGEDVVEVNCHGGVQVSHTILELLLKGGLRLADPGEFTRRAFLNGRIDLTQVEGTIDLIHARTNRAARLGSRMMADGLGEQIRQMLTVVVESRALIEAAIDFGEEEGTEVSTDTLLERLHVGVRVPVRSLIEAYAGGKQIRHGLHVVLAGKPNVGKSSLMNRLLRKDRVIVTEVPGTTRDTIEEYFEIDGIPIVLTDTAGVRNSMDPIEKVGQERTLQAIDTADLILLMIDASRPIDESDLDLLQKLGNRSYLVLRNKIDLVPEADKRSRLASDPAGGYVDISALQGMGLADLKRHLFDAAGLELAGESDSCLPNLRQKDLLVKVEDALAKIFHFQPGFASLETMSIDLKDCERYLNQVLGIDVEQDVLDDIFRRFCIGK